MIVKEKLDRIEEEVNISVVSLFDKLRKNEKKNSNNILLLLLNGEYRNDKIHIDSYLIHTTAKKLASNDLNSYFIFLFQTLLVTKEVSDEKRLKEQDKYNLNTQLELNLCLKLWEDASFLNRLYNIKEIIEGRLFDWGFDVTSENGNFSRKNFLEITFPDAIKMKIPKLYAIYKKIYNRQIRNAVAHSKYFISNNKIHFLNYNPDDNQLLKSISIKEWEDIFHYTCSFYIHFERNIDIEKKKYAEQINIMTEVKSNPHSKYGKIQSIGSEIIEFDWLINPKF